MNITRDILKHVVEHLKKLAQDCSSDKCTLQSSNDTAIDAITDTIFEIKF